jgi:hypothetical protein
VTPSAVSFVRPLPETMSAQADERWRVSFGREKAWKPDGTAPPCVSTIGRIASGMPLSDRRLIALDRGSYLAVSSASPPLWRIRLGVQDAALSRR